MTNYTDLIARLRHGVGIINLEEAGILDWSTLSDAADAIEALMKERDELTEWKKQFEEYDCDEINVAYAIADKYKEELAALRKQIDELQPVIWKIDTNDAFWFQEWPEDSDREEFTSTPLFSLEGIKK